jgi:hypothetical protein
VSDQVVLRVSGHEVGAYVVEPAVHRLHGPRPFLHPVRTLGGITVTDAGPLDHPWHLGASLGMQDVNGTNLWGGRTYVRGLGYTWLGDHGRISHVEWLARGDDGMAHRLHWYDPADRILLVEDRSLTAAAIAGRPDAWLLDVAYSLSTANGSTVSLGSPGTNGRPGAAGYGGFFWRAVSSEPATVFSPTSDDEEKVNGSTQPWVAMVTKDPSGAPATLVFTGLGEGDVWFVRAADYPGVCVALAFDERRVIRSDEPLRRRHRVIICDGALDAESVSELLSALPD